MEDWQVKILERNTGDLYELTEYNPHLLRSLQKQGIITNTEIIEFERIQDYDGYGRFKCHLFLLNILKRRFGAYNIFIKVLEEHFQTDAAQILKNGGVQIDDEHFDANSSTSSKHVGLLPSRGIKRQSECYSAAVNYNRPSKSSRFLHNLEEPTSLFVGRKTELLEVYKLLHEPNQRAVISHIASVSGLGGIGKTQLARKFAQVYEQDFDNNVIWLNADSEESLIRSITNLAKDKLNICTLDANGAQKHITTIVQAIFDYFQDIKCLFIYDNAEKSTYLQTFLPKMSSSKMHYVLITSRHQDWRNIAPVVGLDILSQDEAMKFVRDGLEIKNHSFDEDIRKLVLRLQYFPLAIQQAISFIYQEQKMGNYTILKYLDEFEINTGLYLDSEVSDELESDYTKTTFTTWKITIEKIAQSPEYGYLALKIFNLAAYFSPEENHRDTFYNLDECTMDMVKEAVNLLVKYSMITPKARQSIFSIHRLVQEVVRIDLRRSGKEYQNLDAALRFVQKCLAEKSIVHAISAWNFAKSSTDLISKYLELPHSILEILRSCGRYTEAGLFGKNAVEVIKHNPLTNKLRVLDFERNLGSIFSSAGDFETSLYYLERIQEECKLRTKPMALLSVQTEIAWTYNLQGRYSEALELGHNVTEGCKSFLGEGQLFTANVLFMTAAIARNMGKYDLAYSTFQECFRCYDLANKKDLHFFLMARHDFALLTCDKGSVTDGLAILEDVLGKINENPALKASFNLRTNTMHNIGNYLNRLGKHEEAHKSLMELYEEHKSVLGEDHHHTLSTKNLLGAALLGMKKYEEAYSAAHTAYTKLKEKFGLESIWALRAGLNCAIILSHQEHHNTAISLIVLVNKSLESTLESKNIELLNCTFEYGQILARADKCEEAIIVLENAKKMYSDNFGDTHYDYLRCVDYIEEFKLGKHA